MYLLNTYEGKRDMKKGIAFSDGKAGKWGAPEAIKIPNLDIQGDFYGFHVSEDGNTIIISYEGPGTLGKEDLYVSVKTEALWSEPLHMGSSINSSGFEISPFELIKTYLGIKSIASFFKYSEVFGLMMK